MEVGRGTVEGMRAKGLRGGLCLLGLGLRGRCFIASVTCVLLIMKRRTSNNKKIGGGVESGQEKE